ncbi:MAG TPA: DUF5117 domain-containing protein, partial [Holophagaceae bacterium]
MLTRSLSRLALALAAATLLGPNPLTAQNRPAPHGAPNGTGPARPSAEAGEPKPYDKVVTAEAKSQSGLLKVHQVKDKLYFEIPKGRLGEELLLVVSADRVPTNIDHAGRVVGNEVVRWVLKDHRVLLEAVAHSVVADPGLPVARAVAAATSSTILMSFPVETFASDGSPVIDAGKLFTTEVPELSARQLLGAQSFDPSRAFVDKVRAFPINVNVEAVQTYSVPFSPTGATASRLPTPMGTPTLHPGTSGTVSMFFSFVQLPGKP